MPGMFTWFGRIAFFPAWILWRGYTGLWWAFDDTRPAKRLSGNDNHTSNDGKSGAVGDEPMPLLVPKRPTPALVMGLLATVGVSLAMLVAMSEARAQGVITPDRAGAAWILATLGTGVGTILLIRWRHRQRVAKAQRGWRGIVARASKKVQGNVGAAARHAVHGGKVAMDAVVSKAGPVVENVSRVARTAINPPPTGPAGEHANRAATLTSPRSWRARGEAHVCAMCGRARHAWSAIWTPARRARMKAAWSRVSTGESAS
ncbi:MAG: hypothetical protein IPK69_10230 [Phycisphaerales bacterium]|nr:MAG: hypothetical protein IPK69_10230 [Phycisphaerales bacterium]